MYKGIIIVGVLLVVVVVLVPAGFGFLATSYYQRFIDSINESGELQLKVVKQQRGWLASDVLLQVHLSPQYHQSTEQFEKPGDDVPVIYILSTLHHGPFPLSGEALPFSASVAHVIHQLIESPDTNRPVELFDYAFTADIHFDGSQQINVEVYSSNQPLEFDQVHINWETITAKFDLKQDVSDLLMNVNVPFLQLTTANSELLIDSLLLDSEIKKGIEGLALGSSIMSVDRFLVRESTAELDYFIKDVNVHTESNARQSLIDMDIRVKMGNLGIAEERFEKAEFNLAFRNLDAGVMARLSNKYRQLLKQGPLPEQQAKIVLGTTLLMEMANFLQSGPELELVSFRLQGGQDSMDGYAKLAVDNSRPLLLSNPVLVQETIKANVRLVIPESLLVSYQTALLRLEHARAKLKTVTPRLRELAMARVKDSLAPFVDTRMLRYADHKYQLDASLERGNLLINGEPLHLPPNAGLTP